ncbi:MAG: energy-coupling factor transporter transmembrane protein EcfT [candidate division KSB1 bacterium]|nr:energy-coupling factor transporter transmembrane protein EcfT [candidate division KSB1 bacterium]MDZ7346252.1 energy-coupling factor transporter transmembrane protein EcfT [candidate division KSB1 bacterium]
MESLFIFTIVMALLSDISLGQYCPRDSFIHRLDPRTKLLSVLFLMTALLFSFRFPVLMAFFAVILAAVWGSRLPAALVLRNLRPFLWLFLLTIAVHLFWTPGRVIARLPIIQAKISEEGLRTGLFYTIRLALLIVAAALLTLTTSPVELTDGLERLFKPLKRFRVPVHEIVMMLTLALRFIPTLLEEAQRIRNAQMSRGVSFEGSLVQRIRNTLPLILPLFFSAFRRADELAMAMDARCYTGGDGRTSYTRLAFRFADYAVLLFSAALLLPAFFF